MKYLFMLIFSFQAWSLDLKPGDVLLQPLHCYLCNLIEAQTESIYSHIGIVIKVKGKEVKVAEAFGSVKSLSLEEFLTKTQKHEKVKVVRPRFKVKRIDRLFHRKFSGLSYDEAFLWKNKDSKGEKLYCSELVYKLLRKFSKKLPKPEGMKYDVYPELWRKYFQGDPPTGKLGLSPAHFDDSRYFKLIGEL